MENNENKFPIDTTLLQVAIGNILNDIVYYQLEEISKIRPLTEEGAEALNNMREIMSFEKIDLDIKLLASLQDELEVYNNNN